MAWIGGDADGREVRHGSRSCPIVSSCGAVHDRSGHPLAVGEASRGQPLRRAAVRRALRARAPRGRRSRPPTRASSSARAARRSTRSRAIPTPCSPTRAAPRCVAVGQSLPFKRGGSVSLPIDVSRTLEDLLDRAELDFVHVHEPFAPSAASAALRHSRALNVGTFHSTTERFVSTQVARKVVELLFGRLDGRTASYAATRDLIERYFPGHYDVIHPGADLLHRPDAAGGPPRDRVLGRGGARRRCGSSCARCASCRSSSTGTRRSGCAIPASAPAVTLPRRAARPRDARRAGRRLGGAAPRAGDDRRRRLERARRRPRSSCCGRSRAAPCPWSSRLPQYEELVRDGELGPLFEPRDALTLAAQLERLVADPSLVSELRRAHRAGPPAARRGRASRTTTRRSTSGIAARRHDADGQPALRKRLARARLHPRRPAHAHRPLARLRDAGRHAARHGQEGRPRRDRDHRPQRGLGRARGARARRTGSR